MSSTLRPPFDPELEQLMKTFPDTGEITYQYILQDRKDTDAQFTHEIVTSDPEISSKEVNFSGPDGNTIELTVVYLKTSTSQSRPCIYHTHGGGFVMGNRYMSLDALIPFIKEFDLVVVSVEYRLAPEFKAPTQVEDSYAGLKWVSDNASELGIDAAKIVTYGGSAGGGLAAGITLLARDRKGPALLAQCLVYPMLDDRAESVSNRQYPTGEPWSAEMNRAAWAFTSPNRGKDDVSIYVAPARATSLSKLPKTFIEVGSAEPLRDESVAYAMKLWECGNEAELHVWPGAWHAYDVLAAQKQISKDALAAKLAWFRRIFGSPAVTTASTTVQIGI